ncbi:MAG: DUF1385 domain-containing protein [Armatimonadetes bacterium]|nr:DUF1385 domain-containing protein [Armatimonadota bacterium]
MSAPPLPDPLGMPAGALARPVDAVESSVSIRAAARHMAECGLLACPVVADGLYLGTLRQSDLTKSLAEGIDLDTPVDNIVRHDVPTVRPYETGAEALRRLSESGEPVVVVLDDGGRVVGLLTAARLFSPPRQRNRPKMVGGMATPVGVYLTSGSTSGGAPWWGLVLSGALMACLLLVAQAGATGAGLLVPLRLQAHPAVDGALNALTFFLFMGLLRAMPLAGTHAAEHMTVHAIERGEDLVPEVVRRMPRVHPRCGTNYMAGLTIFMAVAFGPTGKLRGEVSILLGLLAMFLFWKPVGSFLQYWFTTRPPTDAQIASGIKAGQELLNNYEKAPNHVASPWRRLVYSGIFYVVMGGWAASMLVYWIERVLRVPDPWRVSL